MDARTQIPAKPVAVTARPLSLLKPAGMPLRSAAASQEPAAPDYLAAGPGHSFSRMRASVPALVPVRLPELGCLSWLHQGTAGDTGCDVSVGTPSSTINSPSPCYRACTERHEAVHVRDLSSCCKKANQAYNAGKSDDKKAAVQDRMNQWVLDNQDFLECRAYGESVRCAEEFLAANCGAPKTSQSTDTSSDGGQPSEPGAAKNDTEMAGADEASAGSLVSEKYPAAQLADDTAAETPVDPKICCGTVKDYATHHRFRRDALCAAKKSLTACPF